MCRWSRLVASDLQGQGPDHTRRRMWAKPFRGHAPMPLPQHEVLVPRYGLCQDMLASYQDTLSQCTTRCVMTPNRNACIRYIYYAKAVGKYVIHWITSLTACATSSTLHYIAVPLQACTLHPRTWDFTHQKTQWLHCRQERTYVQRITQTHGRSTRESRSSPPRHVRRPIWRAANRGACT